jgi:branched-chain amino acid transport system permease protein
VSRLGRLAAGAALAALLVAAPLVATTFQLALLTQGLVWATLGLSVWLLLRKLALPSFGHAAFFGVAAYTAGLAVTRWGVDSVYIALAVSIGMTCAVALPIALIASRLSGVSFLLITLAFAEMLHSLALRWKQVGGSDGLVGVIRPSASPLPLEISEPTGFFYFALGVFAICALVLVVIVRSPFGGVLVGIRESEERMSALGYNPVAYRIAAFLVSAAIAGAAGVLDAYLTRFVSPDDVSALVSARALLIVVIGGVSLVGAAGAGIALTALEDFLSSRTDRWLGVLGALYILVALLALEPGRGRAALERIAGVLRGPGRQSAPAVQEQRP